jgi:predicted negative regulator of RcsB-dependent stress response
MQNDESSGYDPPPGLEEARPARGHASSDDLSEAGAGPGAPPPRRSPGLKLAVGALLVVLVAGALLGYRSWHRKKVLAEGMAIAETALRLDTAAGYRRAADTLEPLARLDPLEAASMRAFALAMLAGDYRETRLGSEAEALIAAPGRSDTVPAWADLASAALYLGRGEVGDAATYAGRAGNRPLAGALLARLALLAGNPEAGFEPLQRSLAADPKLVASLAVQGDLIRRLRHDVHAARSAYAAALASSRTHPRATYGLAKLALASQIPLNEAIPPLRALLEDVQGTPANERARAALHLAALELRAGEKAASKAVLDQVEGLDGPGRAWAEVAVLVAAADRKGYRAVKGPPPIFVSASDDDPLEAAAIDPTPPPPPPKAAPKPASRPSRKAPAPARKPAAKKPPAGTAR